MFFKCTERLHIPSLDPVPDRLFQNSLVKQQFTDFFMIDTIQSESPQKVQSLLKFWHISCQHESAM